ncbi:MAG: ImmA/IrrE family metallo-endopeptidase [Acidimicrobiia bacterium]|nr:MAG: ImmA/IrrE family metallo-endopeptidase [Acidimicrobiia bacterium]
MTNSLDSLIIGQQVRHHRKRRGLTLEGLGQLVGKPASYLSLLENGKREPRIALLNDIAHTLEVPVSSLLEAEAPTRRAQMEIALERAQNEPLYAELGLPHLKATARMPATALEHVLGLYEALRERTLAATSTREGARAANAELRSEMKRRGNYFAEIEQAAADAVAASGYQGSHALTEGDINQLAAHFGFTVARERDVPSSVRSVTDLRNRRIYVPQRDSLTTRSARSVVIQTLGHFALGHEDPADFNEFLRQRVEANYFAGAVLIPEVAAVPILAKAKKDRDISVEDLRDLFYVSYEMAAHRLTNLATEHLDLKMHFVRSDESGIIWKAYENNDVPFPQDANGAIEGMRLCRKWGTRQAFHSRDKFDIHYQYTDTADGTFWCGTHVEDNRVAAITAGADFADAQFFRGRDTKRHTVSGCPAPTCCRRPDDEVSKRWDGLTWPSVRPNSHVLAAMPVETIPGVDLAEVYEFLETHDS